MEKACGRQHVERFLKTIQFVRIAFRLLCKRLGGRDEQIKLLFGQQSQGAQVVVLDEGKSQGAECFGFPNAQGEKPVVLSTSGVRRHGGHHSEGAIGGARAGLRVSRGHAWGPLEHTAPHVVNLECGTTQGVPPVGFGEAFLHPAAMKILAGALSLLLFSSCVGFSTFTAQPITVGDIEADPPTVHTVGLSLPVLNGDENHDASVRVYYRQVGTSTWNDALPLQRVRPDALSRAVPSKFPIVEQFAGSIFDLHSDSTYEVRLAIDD